MRPRTAQLSASAPVQGAPHEPAAAATPVKAWIVPPCGTIHRFISVATRFTVSMRDIFVEPPHDSCSSGHEPAPCQLPANQSRRANAMPTSGEERSDEISLRPNGFWLALNDIDDKAFKTQKADTLFQYSSAGSLSGNGFQASWRNKSMVGLNHLWKWMSTVGMTPRLQDDSILPQISHSCLGLGVTPHVASFSDRSMAVRGSNLPGPGSRKPWTGTGAQELYAVALDAPLTRSPSRSIIFQAAGLSFVTDQTNYYDELIS